MKYPEQRAAKIKQSVKNNLGTAAVGLALLALLAATAFDTGISKQRAAEISQKLYENRTGQNTEILNVDSSNYLYRVNLRTRQDTVATYIVSKGGGLAVRSSNAVNPMSQLSYFKFSNSVKDCLDRRNITLYGNSSREKTANFIRALGAENIGPIYKDIQNRSNLNEAVENGVQRTPTLVYGDKKLVGVQDLETISEFAGCNIQLSEN